MGVPMESMLSALEGQRGRGAPLSWMMCSSTPHCSRVTSSVSSQGMVEQGVYTLEPLEAREIFLYSLSPHA